MPRDYHGDERSIQSNHSVYNRQSSIEGQLRYLRRGKFAVRIPELDNRGIILSGVCVRADAVKSCCLDWVIDCYRIFQVDRFGYNGGFRKLGRVGRKDERTELFLGAEFRFDIAFVTDRFLFLS